MELIIIGAVVIVAMPFLIFGVLTIFAVVGMGGLRRSADSIRSAHGGDGSEAATDGER